MKKFLLAALSALFIILFLFSISACGASNGGKVDTNSFDDANIYDADDDKKQDGSGQDNPSAPETPSEVTIDEDLTQLNDILAYAKAFDIASSPTSYFNKVLKIRGTFGVHIKKERSYFIYVSDLTACCTQGLEFVWPKHKYPDDYPKTGDEIEIVGTYRLYIYNSAAYFRIDVITLTRV